MIFGTIIFTGENYWGGGGALNRAIQNIVSRDLHTVDTYVSRDLDTSLIIYMREVTYKWFASLFASQFSQPCLQALFFIVVAAFFGGLHFDLV